MRRLRAWIVRLAAMCRRSRGDADFAAELQSHLQLHIDDNVRAGMAPDEARRRALLALGGIEATKERQRDRRGIPLLDALRQDVVYAARTLRKNPGFSIVAIVTLALGIGANTAIFSVVNAVLLRPLPFRDPGQLVMIFATDAKRGDQYDVTSYPAFLDWKEQSRSFESIAAYTNRMMTVGIGNEAVFAEGKPVTASVFDVLGVRPALGRAFRDDEQRAGAPDVVVLSDGFWKGHYGGNAAALGQTLHINGKAHTILGVMPAGFFVESENEELYEPLAIDPNRGHGFLRVIARLRRGVFLQQARSDMAAIADRLARTYPNEHPRAGTNVMPLTDALARNVRFGLLTMIAVVALVLLIACTNVAGLMLARGATRQRELAVRAALGAGRGRLVRQLMTESALIALAGGAFALVAAEWTARALAATLSEHFRVPRITTASTDAVVLAFTVAVSITTGIVFGAFPAFASSSPDLNDALRHATRSSTGARAPRLRRGLVVLETALALVLLAGAGTLLKTFLVLRATPPGFDATHVLKADLFLAPPRFADVADRVRFYDAALERLRAVPGVRSAAFVSDLPLNGSMDGLGFHIVGRPDPAPGKSFSSGFNMATAGYFATLGIPVRSGREFDAGDRVGTLPVVVVNETAERTFWPDESPLGRQIVLPGPNGSSQTLTVVGATGDVRQASLGVPPRPEIFLCSMQAQLPWAWSTIAVRAYGDPAMLAQAVKAAMRDADSSVTLRRVNTLEEVVALSIGEPRIYAFLLGTFAALALLLATIGLYGLVAYSVSQRTHELGVRVALGATRAEIVRLVLRQGLCLVVVGAALGLAGAFATTRLLVGLVKGVEPNDPATFFLVTVVLLLAALTASYLPARRAGRVDAMVALRTE